MDYFLNFFRYLFRPNDDYYWQHEDNYDFPKWDAGRWAC